MKEVLLTDMLDKSEVQHQGLMTMSCRPLFSSTCAVVVLLCRRAAHVVSICGGGGPANVHFAECSLEGRLGGGSPARCSRFSVLASASFNWRLPAEFFFGNCDVKGVSTERGTKGLRSQHCATEHGQVGVRAGGTRDKGTKAAVGKTGPPHRTGTRTGRYAHTSARSHVV